MKKEHGDGVPVQTDFNDIRIDKLKISDTLNAIPLSETEDTDLVHELRTLAKNQPKLVRGKKYDIPGQSFQLTSWKMTEHMYTRSPCPFPTLARGFFTRWIPRPGREGEPEGKKGAGLDQIVVRGYDKFFNMNEVKWNTWESLGVHTTSPYVLTLKSNGCIIFMAALSSTEIIVTSKHSLGEVVGSAISHANKGEEWLHKHLKSAGKTKVAFAKELFDRNITAIAELCDDSFEEHVLPYSKEMSGLHLHGLNERRGEFCTLPNDQVESFAREWGFIPTSTTTFNTIDEVRAFTSEIGETGKWRGEAVEGFVVRTTISDREPQLVQAYRGTRGERITDKQELSTPPPYSPGSTFFFKIKFEEPYLMYREWREATKRLLSAADKGQLDGTKLSAFMLRRPETRAYVQWVTEQIRSNPGSLARFNDGHGIIAARERFLEWCETSEGLDVLKEENRSVPTNLGNYEGPHKSIIMPVAIPGSGKTAIAIALQHLFGFAHTQSDDVQQKKTGPQFVKNVMELFKKNDVVFADRNNHIKHLREALRHEFKGRYGPKGHFIALQWLLNHTPQQISDICAKRIVSRGENHQTLFADDQDSHLGVISTFYGSFEEVESEEADDVIDMEYDETLDQAVKRAVAGLCPILDLKTPGEKEIAEACEIARAYEVSSKNKKKSAAPKPPRYYAFVPKVDLEGVLGEKMKGEDVPATGRTLWAAITKEKRLPDNPHVTLIHSKEKHEAEKLWEQCNALRKAVPDCEAPFRVEFDHVVWNDNVMALSASNFEIHTEAEGEYSTIGSSIIKEIPEKITKRLHLTVGIREEGVSPFEAAGMVEGWRKGEANGAHSIALKGCVVDGKIVGRYS